MKAKLWNVIRQLEDPTTGELTGETLVRSFFLQDEAERYAEKHAVRPIDGELIVTRRQPMKGGAK